MTLTTTQIKRNIIDLQAKENKTIEGFILEYDKNGNDSSFVMGCRNIGLMIFSDRNKLQNIIYFKCTKTKLQLETYWN